MNLQLLNSPLPKPWLDISCNKLTCNELAIPVQPVNNQLFQCFQSVSVPTVGSTTVLCDTVQIANPNFNIATNQYTAPSNQYVQVILKGVTNLGAVGATAAPLFVLTVNGADVVGQASSNTVVLPSFGTLALSLVGVVSLNAGDVLGIRVTNIVAAGMFNQFYSLCGIVI